MVNRVYLLVSLLLSMVFPLLDLTGLISLLQDVPIGSKLAIAGKVNILGNVPTGINWLTMVYWMGLTVNCLFLLYRLMGVKRQFKLAKKGSAFSFWKTKVIDHELEGWIAIDAHENIHIKQLHTFDILLVEAIGVLLWFNPIIYAYRRSLKLVHEYLADEHACKFAESKRAYAMLLFFQNLNAGPVLGHNFGNAPLLEYRINMLKRKKSAAYQLWKYALCIPLLLIVALLCSFGARANQPYHLVQAASFPGGFGAFSNYLTTKAIKKSPNKGKVVVGFIVEANGEISHAKVAASVDRLNDNEAIRVISSSPKWIPAIKNGENVRSAYQIGINF